MNGVKFSPPSCRSSLYEGRVGGVCGSSSVSSQQQLPASARGRSAPVAVYTQSWCWPPAAPTHSSPRTLHPPQTPGPGASPATTSDHTSTSDSVTRPAAALGPGQGRRGAEWSELSRLLPINSRSLQWSIGFIYILEYLLGHGSVDLSCNTFVPVEQCSFK